MSHWVYRGKKFLEVPEDAFGFIYRITNKKSGKKYIGRKYFYTTRRVKVKNKKRRKVVVKESNWKAYTGSSGELNELIDTIGHKNFKFEILGIAYTKGQLNYMEENIQHKLDVLIDDSYYNYSVGSRRYMGMRIDDQFKKVIRDISL